MSTSITAIWPLPPCARLYLLYAAREFSTGMPHLPAIDYDTERSLVLFFLYKRNKRHIDPLNAQRENIPLLEQEQRGETSVTVPQRPPAPSTISPIEKIRRGLTAPLRVLPDFLIVGTQRGGTTSLYHYLLQSPYVESAMVKELHFFDKQFTKGILWYRAHFPTLLHKYTRPHPYSTSCFTGEASAYYLFHPHVARRVKAVVPQAKIIILLRNPVDRAYSQYCLEVELDRESLSFEEALEREEERINKETEKVLAHEYYVSPNHSRYSYKARGRYIEQLPAWQSLFPPEQILILKSEDLYTNTTEIVEKTLKFLGLPELASQQKDGLSEVKNYVKHAHPKLKPATREKLAEYFAPYNQRLYQALDRDFGWDH